MSEMDSFSISVYLKGGDGATSEGLIEFISGKTKLDLDRGIIKALKMEYDYIEVEIYSSMRGQ